MASGVKNQAAYIVAEKKSPLEVRDAPTPQPADDEVVIKVAYAAINPTDWKMQDYAYIPMVYPNILGVDVSGTIAYTGKSATRFKPGQRVIGHCDSLMNAKAERAAFQLYTVCKEHIVSPVPENVPLENAAVIPLGFDTAMAALFVRLELPLPSLNPKSTSKTLLVWGGSSSVGSSAVQLAVAAGLRVITTASSANFDMVKGIGASEAYDHHSGETVNKILSVLKPGDHVFDAVGLPETQETCAKISRAIGQEMLPTVLPPAQAELNGVKIISVNACAPLFTSEELEPAWRPGAKDLGIELWSNYLPKALEAGKFQAKPDAYIIRGGLGKVQEGIDLVRKGVSAQKVVIEIAP